MASLDNVCFVIKDETRSEWRFYIQEGQESITELITTFDIVNGGYVDENILKCIDRYMISDYVFLGIICYVESDSFRSVNDDK